MKTTILFASMAALATASPFHWPWGKTVTATRYPVFTTPTPGSTPTPSGYVSGVIPQPTHEVPKPKPKVCSLICVNKPIGTCGEGWHSEKVGNCYSCCKDKDVHGHEERRHMGSEVRAIW